MSRVADGLWRSEDMVYVRLQMQRETAHETIKRIGLLGVAEFIDLEKNTSCLSRKFSLELRRCEELERRVDYLISQTDQIESPEDHGSCILPLGLTQAAPTLDSLDAKLEEYEKDVRDLNAKFEQMNAEMNRNREFHEVLRRETAFFHGGDEELTNRSVELASRELREPERGLSLLTGVLEDDKLHDLEKLIYRATKGNSFVRFDPIEDTFLEGPGHSPQHKTVFAVFFSAPRIHQRLMKVCQTLEANLYPYREGMSAAIRAQLTKQISALRQALAETQRCRDQTLADVQREIHTWKALVQTKRAVYQTLNKITFAGMTCVAEAWVPKAELGALRRVVTEAEVATGVMASTVVQVAPPGAGRTPPTFFRVDKYTETFQGIVESYGVARYKEVNPAVLSVVTFPYLFGVMYGDVGHGVMLTAVAVYLIARERYFLRNSQGEMFDMIFGARYLLVLMGVFATYIGMLYNDTFGLVLGAFPSGYQWLRGEGHDFLSHEESDLSPTQGFVTWFGVDSAWAETENKLEFMNSLKMKGAIIIGVLQMFAGLFLGLLNHLYFRDWKRVWFEFVPEAVFLMCTFGYMAILILLKWCTAFGSTHDAPSLLETMTNFFLAPGTVLQPLYAGQAGMQVFLLLVAFLMIPTMLFPIPYLEWRAHKKRCSEAAEKARTLPVTVRSCTPQPGSQNVYASDNTEPFIDGDKSRMPIHEVDTDDGGAHDLETVSVPAFDLSEVVIHQMIHTIEFVLGCVSNTASYLRLWALSLAHAELSEVFWNFAFLKALDMDSGNGVIVFVGFGVWLTVTIGVLLMMEGLSAFLHALRLHWVEFQNKFYLADGKKFSPFVISDAALYESCT